MSASLVGSEMCIRDRSSIAQRCATKADKHGMCAMFCLSSVCIVIDNAPVSYTHLTLPTICSV
eukprot:8390948-Alexandrium_andersonii.AAC.1